MIFGYPASYGSHSDVTAMEYLLSGVGRDIKSTKDLDGINLLVLFGGEDISPSIYGEDVVYAHAPSSPSLRDSTELELINICIDRGIPILGLCRGAQLACCYLKGSLWQHVDGHEGDDHKITMHDGSTHWTNSYHHQLMIPTEEMEVLGWAECRSPDKYGNGPYSITSYEDEPEIVYHRSKKVLMIQGHPEWCEETDDLFKLTQQLVKELL